MQPKEENFDALRRALKLKRHEQPPPRYFNEFSACVIRRICENDVQDRATKMDEAAWEAPWVIRLLERFQARPIYAGILGATVCALMISGIIYSERPVAPGMTENNLIADPQNSARVGLVNGAVDNSLLGSSASPIGALPPGTTLFDKVRPLQSGTMPVFGMTNLLK